MPDRRITMDALPEPLRQMRRFLFCKHTPGANGKTRKTPYYASGGIRKGRLDSEQDLKQLVSFDEAHDAYLLGDFAGIGFALTGDGVGAFDLDHCLDEQGQLIEGHAGHGLVLNAKRAGAYTEISPSGRGLRIIGPCQIEDAYSKDQLEYWGVKRYVTVTGDVWANPKGWADLTAHRSSLGSPRAVVGDEDEHDPGIITPRTIDELRDALESITADERELWVRMGMALKGIGPKGRTLWLDWSATSHKFDLPDAERVWDSLDPKDTDYRAVFAKAQRNGWQNPRARDRNGEGSTNDREIDLGEPIFEATEFVLDGFMPAQVSVIAGVWGSGKSTNLLPLMASVAHLSPEEWGFQPDLRRHIIWVTEAPEQARDTLLSLHKAAGAAPWVEFRQWFHLFSARREAAKDIADWVKERVDEWTWTTDNGFAVKPVVVLDTTTANVDLENESDNSQVGAAMSILKQSLPRTPIVLIGHTPKAMGRAEVENLTFRGAGAWEAEAAATYFLAHDPDTEMRFLVIGKCRFAPTYREIHFDHEGGSVPVETPWGDAQTKQYLHGVPSKSNGEVRRAARQEVQQVRREEREQRHRTELQERVLEVVRDGAANGELVTRPAIKAAIGGRDKSVLDAITQLIEDGLVIDHKIDREHFGSKLSGPTPGLLLPPEVDVEIYLRSGDATGNQLDGKAA